jgi:hypothetical protein
LCSAAIFTTEKQRVSNGKTSRFSAVSAFTFKVPRISQSESVHAVETAETVQTFLFPKFRRSRYKRKGKAKACLGKQFGPDDQMIRSSIRGSLGTLRLFWRVLPSRKKTYVPSQVFMLL